MSELLNSMDPRTAKDIQYARKLRELHRSSRRKWTESQIATACNTSVQVIRGWFNGFGRPDDLQKEILAKMFRVKVKELEYV